MKAATNLPVLTCQAFLNHCPADHCLHLYSDFDGTLVPLQADPMTCHLSASQAATLRALAAVPGVHITIVSGRRLVDLRSRIGIAGLGYVGNHGLEIATPSHNFVHPGALALATRLGQWQSTLQAKLEPFTGAWIENKELSLSIHYRTLAECRRQDFMAVIENYKGAITEDGQLVISDAKQVVEIRPNLGWTKGSAIQVVDDYINNDYINGDHINEDHINKDRNRARRVYFGDDISDEDAFAQWQQDLTVLVGEANRQTHANHRLGDYHQTHRLLDALRARFDPDHP